jgi:hypothetical protein
LFTRFLLLCKSVWERYRNCKYRVFLISDVCFVWEIVLTIKWIEYTVEPLSLMWMPLILIIHFSDDFSGEHNVWISVICDSIIWTLHFPGNQSVRINEASLYFYQLFNRKKSNNWLENKCTVFLVDWTLLFLYKFVWTENQIYCMKISEINTCAHLGVNTTVIYGIEAYCKTRNKAYSYFNINTNCKFEGIGTNSF